MKTLPGQKVRILDLINTDNSAKELLEHRVAQVNATGRFDNAICCSPGPYVERLRAKGLTIHVIDTPRGLSPVPLAVSVWRVARLLKRERFHILHTHCCQIGLIGRLAALLARTPVVIHQVHGFHHHENMPAAQAWVFIKAEQVLALIADRLLFQNQADMDECLRRRIAPRSKLALVGNGIQIDAFGACPEPGNRPPVILCVARFEPVKNHQQLFDAARLLKESNVEFALHLAGEGFLRPQYEAWVREHGLAQHVRFLGYCDDVRPRIAAAEVCALTSIKEGLPRSLMEAAAAGRPVVATDVVGNRDVIVNGKTGYLVPLHDSAALAAKLRALLDDAVLRATLGQQAREWVRTTFDERRVTDRIIAVYDEFAERPAGA